MEASFIVETLTADGIRQWVEIDTIYYHVPTQAIRLVGRKYQESELYGNFDKEYTLTADNTVPVLVFDKVTGLPIIVEVEGGEPVQLVIGEFTARVEQLKPMIEPLVTSAITRKESGSTEPLTHYR